MTEQKEKHRKQSSERLEQSIYSRVLATAKGYYFMLHRRDQLPYGPVRQKNEEQIVAVEKALADCGNDRDRELIQKNLFEGLPMKYIQANYSIHTMKRIRKNFLVRVAKNLWEI